MGDTTEASLISLNVFIVDTNFFDLLEIPIVDGEYFSHPYDEDTNIYYIINKAAAEFLELANPVGTRLTIPQTRSGEIIGVANDFNFA